MKIPLDFKKLWIVLFFPLMMVVIVGVKYFTTGHVSFETMLLAAAVAIGSPILILLIVWLFMKVADVSSKGQG